MEKHIYFWGDKTPPGVGGLSRAELRLVGIYWISLVRRCEMNHVVNHPKGRVGELELSISPAPQPSSLFPRQSPHP